MSNLPEDDMGRDPLRCTVCDRIVGYAEGQCPPGLHGRIPGELKPARSQAELIRTRNSNILVCLAVAQFSWNIIIGLYILGVI